MKMLLCIVVLFAASAMAAGQDVRERTGTITYVSGEVYYVSLGTGAGMRDSLLLRVVREGNSVATLRVFAVSTKSSACRLVSSVHPPVVGDRIIARISVQEGGLSPEDPSRGDSGSAGVVRPAPPGADLNGIGTGALRGGRSPGGPPSVMVRGRVTARYQVYTGGTSSPGMTRPSLSLSLRGNFGSVPIRFEAAGTFMSTGTAAPFGKGSIGRNRVYRLFIEYDDDRVRVGTGRLLPSAGLAAGYLDGIVIAGKYGVFEIGGAVGYEPDFASNRFSTDRRKFVLFAHASSPRSGTWSFDIGHTKTYLRKSTERSVITAAGLVSPSSLLRFHARSEVDLLSLRNGTIETKPALSSLLAGMDYRMADFLTVGGGVTAWRPVYPVSTISGLPDSVVDARLWVSPTLQVRIFPFGGWYFQESFSPRTTAGSFGSEYFNSVSLGVDNVAGSGIGVRGTHTMNRTSFARTTGYGLSARRAFGFRIDAGIRYQFYRYEFSSGAVTQNSNTVGGDFSVPVADPLLLLLSGEMATGGAPRYRLFFASLSWRF